VALDSWTKAQLDRVAVLAPALGVVPAGAEKTFFRERTGYPVLMRDLDLPTPVDLYPVRAIVPEGPNAVANIGAAGAPASAALPAKGWLPSPLLRWLLEAPIPGSPVRE
jgi:hypothetical protein